MYTNMQKGWESDHKSLHVATWEQLFKKLHLLSLKQYFQIYNPELCGSCINIIRKNQFVITQYIFIRWTLEEGGKGGGNSLVFLKN